LGLDHGDKIGIMTKNYLEWGLTDYAVACQSLVIVPVYESYGAEDCEFIIVHSDMRAIVCSPDKLFFLSKIKQSKTSNLQYIIVIDQGRKANGGFQAATYTFADIVKLNVEKRVPDVIPGPDDLFSIVCTSGKTGAPKGALLTHNNNITAGAQQTVMVVTPIVADLDTYIFYLLQDYIFGRIVEFFIVSGDGKIAYFSGSIVALMDDVTACKPSLFAGVQRVICKTYDKVKANVLTQPFYKRVCSTIFFYVLCSGFLICLIKQNSLI
jgi:long-chain acyl-CoA synthetase